MRKVRRTKALQLGVEIGEVAALEQRVVRKVDARYDVLSAKGDLLGFGKEIVDEPVEHEPTDDADRRQLFGYDLRRIEHVERKALRELTVEELHAQFPFGKIAGLDRIPEIAAVKVGIGAIDLDGLVPDDRLQAQLGLPVEFDKGRVACCVEQPEGVNAEAFHCAKRARDCPVGHDPHDHVHRFRGETDEIPEIVVRGLGLRKSAIRLWLSGVDDVGKLDRVLDEEDRDVVTDNVPIAFLCVKFDREAAHIAREIGRALGAGDGREADKGLGLLADALKDVGPRHIGEAFGQFEITISPVSMQVEIERPACGGPSALTANPLVADWFLRLKQRRDCLTSPIDRLFRHFAPPILDERSRGGRKRCSADQDYSPNSTAFHLAGKPSARHRSLPLRKTDTSAIPACCGCCAAIDDRRSVLHTTTTSWGKVERNFPVSDETRAWPRTSRTELTPGSPPFPSPLSNLPSGGCRGRGRELNKPRSAMYVGQRPQIGL
jgi:hypothetical protein